MGLQPAGCECTEQPDAGGHRVVAATSGVMLLLLRPRRCRCVCDSVELLPDRIAWTVLCTAPHAPLHVQLQKTVSCAALLQRRWRPKVRHIQSGSSRSVSCTAATYVARRSIQANEEAAGSLNCATRSRCAGIPRAGHAAAALDANKCRNSQGPAFNTGLGIWRGPLARTQLSPSIFRTEVKAPHDDVRGGAGRPPYLTPPSM